VQPSPAVLPLSDSELEEKIRSILAGYNLDSMVKQVDEKLNDQQAAFISQQQQFFNTYKTDLDSNIADIVQRQIDALSSSLKADNLQGIEDGISSAKAQMLAAAAASQGDAAALAALHTRMDDLAASISQLDTNQKENHAALQAAVDRTMAKSVTVAADLEKSQVHLAALDTKARDDTVVLVTALEERLKVLAGDLTSLSAHLQNRTKACCHNDTALLLFINDAVAAAFVVSQLFS
jgi:hypothetical protein